MNLMETIALLAANVDKMSAGVRENMKDNPMGGHNCKICGAPVPHPRAAAAHLGKYHRDALEK